MRTDLSTATFGIAGASTENVITAIRSSRSAFRATAESVTNGLSNFVGKGKVGVLLAEAVASVAGGAIRGAVEVGADLADASKGVMLGALRGVADGSISTTDTIKLTSQAAIRSAASLDADLEAVTRGLLAGAIEGGVEMGLGSETASEAAVEGALIGAEQVNSIAVATVRCVEFEMWGLNNGCEDFRGL